MRIFSKSVLRILTDTGLDPGSLELELTESVLMREAGYAEGTLRALRRRGVRLALDDFGTGHSSLSYLKKFKFDTLKIDQTFIRQITTTPEEIIVSAVIDIGRSLKQRVVAEGVEALEEVAFLEAHQCHEAQGNYFSRPLPPRQFAELLAGGVPNAAVAFRAGSGGMTTFADGMTHVVERRTNPGDRRTNTGDRRTSGSERLAARARG